MKPVTPKDARKINKIPFSNVATIPTDPLEYEYRRVCAQRAVDRVHGPGRYRVVGEPGKLIRLVAWRDCPRLPSGDAPQRRSA